MRRRQLLLSGAGVLATSVSPRAQQQRRARVGVLSDTGRADPAVVAMFNRLAELGWAEARNLVVDFEFADDPARIPAQARTLAGLKCDLLVTHGTPAALAVKAAAPRTPTVFGVGGDPVALGLVASLARPGGSATGWTHNLIETGIKLFGLLKELLPNAQRIAVMLEAGNETSLQVYTAVRSLPAATGMELRAFPLRDYRDVNAADAVLAREPVDALFVIIDRVTGQNGWNIVEMARRRRLPAVYGDRLFFDQGGLLSYGIDVRKSWSLSADYAARILGGARPADLPVQRPTHYQLLVNLNAARLIDIVVPPAVLAQATEVIQ